MSRLPPPQALTGKELSAGQSQTAAEGMAGAVRFVPGCHGGISRLGFFVLFLLLFLSLIFLLFFHETKTNQNHGGTTPKWDKPRQPHPSMRMFPRHRRSQWPESSCSHGSERGTFPRSCFWLQGDASPKGPALSGVNRMQLLIHERAQPRPSFRESPKGP